MVTIYEVAKYFIKRANSRSELLCHLKLQKLCYYAQVWHLAFYQAPMFDDEFEAWAHGPVNYELYGRYKQFGWSPIKEDTEGFQEDSIFDDNQLHVLDQVWKKYGRLNVKVLEALTHGEDPWKKARMLLEKDPYSPAIIVKDDMMSFYRGKIKEESGMENVKYREVNRAAKVGEKIRIVNSHASCYANGDEATVIRKYEDSDGVLADFGQIYDWLVPRDACVVLEPETKITEYRQVKRKAKVGETIKIIHSYPPYYSEKDIAKVCKVIESSGAVLADFTLNEDYRGDGRWLVWLNDYVVFEPIAEGTDEISDIKNEMERLTGELATLALRVSKLEGPKSPQEIRDEIVEKAKADRGTLATRFYGGKLEYTITAPNPPLATYAEFIINRKKRTAVCILRNLGRNRVCSRGIAKCAPGDVFNSHIGRAIALRRALGLKVPTEYLSVPNPTELRKGDIVENSKSFNGGVHVVYAVRPSKRTYKRVVSSPFRGADEGYTFIDKEDIEQWTHIKYAKVIDDSHEEGALDAYLA